MGLATINFPPIIASGEELCRKFGFGEDLDPAVTTVPVGFFPDF